MPVSKRSLQLYQNFSRQVTSLRKAMNEMRQDAAMIDDQKQIEKIRASLRKHGFTLVELLIAVGIIGILSTLALVSVSSVRAKARDSKRLQDVRELAKALDIYANEYPNDTLGVCTQGSRTTTCQKPENALAEVPIAFARVTDPVSGTPACHRGSGGSCQYAIGNENPTSSNFEICFRLEAGSPSLDASQNGVYTISSSGTITPGCSFLAQ